MSNTEDVEKFIQVEKYLYIDPYCVTAIRVIPDRSVDLYIDNKELPHVSVKITSPYYHSLYNRFTENVDGALPDIPETT